ncbi:MAG: dUTP diphosphatase [Candidatus Methanomethylicaceae archaeon]
MVNDIRVFVYTDHGSPNAQFGFSGTENSGIDLRAASAAWVMPLCRKLIRTGLYMAMPNGMEAQVRPRSGQALKRGLTVLNTPGTVDAGYRGEVCVIVYNTSLLPRRIKAGERIAQLVFMPVLFPEVIHVESSSELPPSNRGTGGFGSTGR